MSFAELRTSIVILVCAISAGIHGALAQYHFDEGRGAGLGFVVATVLLVVPPSWARGHPRRVGSPRREPSSPACSGSYALVVATGMPVLHPETDAVEALALFTKAVGAIGLVFVMSLRSSP